MPSYTPLYDASGLISSYRQSSTPPSVTYTGQRTPPPAASGGATQTQNTGVAGQEDLEAWLRANIPGYGGANVASVGISQPSTIGAIPSSGTTAGAGGTGLVRGAGGVGSPAAIQPVTPSIPGVPELPSYQSPAPAPLTPSDPKLDALTAQSLKNIGSGLRGELSQDVIQGLTQRGAERGISIGSNSPNAGAAILRAMGLTSMDVQQAAEKNLQPYQERSAAVNLANIGEQNANYRAILDASEAMRRLQLSEAGQMQRLTVQEAGDTQRAILAGQQALQQISARGNTDVALALINANADQQRQILAGAQAMEQLRLSQSGQIAQLSAQMKAQLQRDVIAAQNALAQIQAQGQNQLNNTALAGQYQILNTQQQGRNELDQILQRYNLQQQDNQAYNRGYNS